MRLRSASRTEQTTNHCVLCVALAPACACLPAVTRCHGPRLRPGWPEACCLLPEPCGPASRGHHSLPAGGLAGRRVLSVQPLAHSRAACGIIVGVCSPSTEESSEQRSTPLRGLPTLSACCRGSLPTQRAALAADEHASVLCREAASIVGSHSSKLSRPRVVYDPAGV